MLTDRAYLGLAASRLVEDVLADLDRLIIFVGSNLGLHSDGGNTKLTASVLELPVEGLAGDFLGLRVRLLPPLRHPNGHRTTTRTGRHPVRGLA